MTFAASTKCALRALMRNPGRSALTTLGIVIGIAAVIAMMEIGNGSATAIRSSIESMGVNTLVVIPGAPRPPGGVRMGKGTAVTLKPEDCDAIRRECPNVSYVAPVVNTSEAQFVYLGKNYQPRQIIGTTPDYFQIRNWNATVGDLFTDEDVENRARVCVVGQTLVDEPDMFDGENPVGLTVRIKNVTFTVIGVLSRKGANMMGMDEDDVVVIPWTTARLRITGLKTGEATNTTSTASTLPSDIYSGNGVAFYPEQQENLETDTLWTPRFTQIDQIQASAISPEQVSVAQEEITALLRERHKLAHDAENDFWIRNAADFMKMLTGTSTLMSNLLLVVALISLVVGGVGIMNIMLVSVTERTREIGLRMAVGARARDILQQFLVESVMLCSLGGIIGILCGHGAAQIIHNVNGWPVEASPGTVAAAFLVSAMVGIVFGFYPAWKAAKMDPIEALRYE